MRNFFTWCIASLLFGLCLLEKEARKNALPLSNEDKNYTHGESVVSEIAVNHDILFRAHYHNDNQMLADDASNGINPPGFASVDSLSLH